MQSIWGVPPTHRMSQMARHLAISRQSEGLVDMEERRADQQQCSTHCIPLATPWHGKFHARASEEGASWWCFHSLLQVEPLHAGAQFSQIGLTALSPSLSPWIGRRDSMVEEKRRTLWHCSPPISSLPLFCLPLPSIQGSGMEEQRLTHQQGREVFGMLPMCQYVLLMPWEALGGSTPFCYLSCISSCETLYYTFRILCIVFNSKGLHSLSIKLEQASWFFKIRSKTYIARLEPHPSHVIQVLQYVFTFGTCKSISAG